MYLEKKYRTSLKLYDLYIIKFFGDYNRVSLWLFNLFVTSNVTKCQRGFFFMLQLKISDQVSMAVE